MVQLRYVIYDICEHLSSFWAIGKAEIRKLGIESGEVFGGTGTGQTVRHGVIFCFAYSYNLEFCGRSIHEQVDIGKDDL